MPGFDSFWQDYGHLADRHLNDFFSNFEADPLLECYPGSDDLLIDFAAVVEVAGGDGLWDERLLEFGRRVQALTTPNAQVYKHYETGNPGKKEYEVARMADFLAGLVGPEWCLVDCGAGQGKLAAEMTARGYAVWAIEGNPQLSKSSVSPWHCWFMPTEVSPEEFHARLQLPPDRPILLYSLHGCGNLSETMLRLYRQDERIKGIVNVGCCYNLLSDHQRFSREALMAACQAPRRWPCQRDATKAALERCFQRAILQPHLHGIKTLGKIKANHWPAYVAEICCKHPQLEEANLLPLFEQLLPSRSRFAMAWALRALVGQVIESAILGKRVQDTPNATLVQLFELAKSPRNLAIVALK